MYSYVSLHWLRSITFLRPQGSNRIESNRLDWTRKYFESIRVESESPSDSNRSSRACSSSSRVQARLESKTSIRVRVQPRLDSNRLVRNPPFDPDSLVGIT